ncbi:MAG: GNAT family N-acetyltransferase [Rhodocyclaceae bacterium]|nr:GNAT family N-acetyltransferase [Rhodocyclaceae bacterium]
MSGDSGGLSLRPIAGEDRAFVFELFSAVHGEALRFGGVPEAMVRQLLEHQFKGQQGQYRAQYPGADFDLVLLDGIPVGYLYASRAPECFVLIDVALVPEVRGRGYATRLVVELLAEAGTLGAAVEAHVVRESPAWRLWRRLGFEVCGDDGVYLAIRRRPDV